jgi:hypothetical protein
VDEHRPSVAEFGTESFSPVCTHVEVREWNLGDVEQLTHDGRIVVGRGDDLVARITQRVWSEKSARFCQNTVGVAEQLLCPYGWHT